MSITPSIFRPRLADHVRACRVGDQMIFLDLLRDKYIGIGGPQLAALSAALLDPSSPPDTQAVPPDSALVDEWIQRLRNEQLLSPTAAAKPTMTATLLEPTTGLPFDDELGVVAADGRHLLRLWRATFVAARWLRYQSLAEIARRVVGMRVRQPETRTADSLSAAAMSYMRLRPLALTSHDRCLNDSLALIHFLATQGLFAKWVIGVSVHPFCAHSWVQYEHVVLNDLPERVRRYQPILVV